MAQVHMSDEELARNLHAALERVKEGDEILVEQDRQPVAVLHSPELRRTISESIAIANRRERERGYAVTLDPDFASDIETVMRSRKPWNPPSWD